MTIQRAAAIPTQRDESVDALSDVTAHWMATGHLPPELVTGHKLIDFEHRFLVSAIANLRKVCIDHKAFSDCSGCGHASRDRCESQLIGLLGDVFSFILDHFKTEEGIMRDSLMLMVDRDVCQAHMEDHAEIAAKVQEIVSALDSMHVVSRIRELEKLLARWMTNHIALHDLMLSRWISRDDSLLQGF
jgi:hemerythrin-like metal-binding protein